MQIHTLGILAVLLVSSISGAEASTAKINTISESDLSLLQEVDKRYLQSDSVIMDVKKTSKNSVFDQTEEFNGTLSLKKGKLRLDLANKDKDKSLVVADGTHLWMVTPPPKEFKGSKTQVLKAPMNTQQARAQGLLQVLTEGGVLKHFKTTGVQKEEGQIQYFLRPQSDSMELRRLVLSLNAEDKTIVGLKYWDSLENETLYDFSKIKFNQKLSQDLFSYKPPKDADIITP